MVVKHNRMDSVDSTSNGCQYFEAVYADNCPNIEVNNNLITNIRDTSDMYTKMMYIINVENTAGVSIKNNLIHHITPESPGMVIMLEGIHVENCSDVVLANNTIDQMDTRGGSPFIQQMFCINIETCTTVTFTNNIVSHTYTSGFPPPCGCAVRATNNDVYCDYTDLYDVHATYCACSICCSYEGTGTIYSDPDYNNPAIEDYDISSTSPAQNGDPSIDDWDGSTGGGSRMGCHGGPGGETVGLLT
jgi:hypothetical protein